MQQVNRFLMPLRTANNLCVAAAAAAAYNSALMPRQSSLIIKNYVVKRTEWYCVDCDIYCNGHTQFNIHLVSQKHKTKLLETRESKYKAIEYDCDECKVNVVKSIDAQVPNDFQVKVSPSQTEIGKKKEDLVIAKPKKYIEGDYSLSKQFDVEAEKYLLPESKRVGKYEKFGYYCPTCDVYMTGQIQLVMHVKGFRHLSHFPEAMPEHMSQKLVRKKPFNRRRPSNCKTVRPPRSRRGLPPIPPTVGLGPNDSIMKRAAQINKQTNKVLDYFNFVAQSKCMNSEIGSKRVENGMNSGLSRQFNRNSVMPNNYPPYADVNDISVSMAQLNLSDYDRNAIMPRVESSNMLSTQSQVYRQMAPVNYLSSPSNVTSNYQPSYFYPLPVYPYKPMLGMPYKLVESNSPPEEESQSKFAIKEEPTNNYVYQHSMIPPSANTYTQQQATPADGQSRPQTPTESDLSTPVARYAPVYQPFNSTPVAQYTHTPIRFVTATHPGYQANHHRIMPHAPDTYAYYSSPHHHHHHQQYQ